MLSVVNLAVKRLLFGSALLTWMGVIFVFSHQPGSGGNWQPPLWYVLERKSAHVVEYAMLMGLSSLFFRVLFPHERREKVMLVAFLFTCTYGLADEIHQSFVFGRGAKFSDALIDAAGAMLMGILLSVWRPRWLERLQNI